MKEQTNTLTNKPTTN